MRISLKNSTNNCSQFHLRTDSHAPLPSAADWRMFSYVFRQDYLTSLAANNSRNPVSSLHLPPSFLPSPLSSLLLFPISDRRICWYQRASSQAKRPSTRSLARTFGVVATVHMALTPAQGECGPEGRREGGKGGGNGHCFPSKQTSKQANQ